MNPDADIEFNDRERSRVSLEIFGLGSRINDGERALLEAAETLARLREDLARSKALLARLDAEKKSLPLTVD